MIDPAPVPAPSPEQERKTVIKVYGFVFLMLLFGCIPNIIAAAITLILFTAVTPVAGHVRNKAAPDSFTADHMTYIIRTVWIFVLFALILIFGAAVYVWMNYDTSPLQPCVDKMMSAAQAGQQPTPDMMMPCIEPFLIANRILFLKAGLAAGGPTVLYLVLRLLRGLARARKNERIANPRSWF